MYGGVYVSIVHLLGRPTLLPADDFVLTITSGLFHYGATFIFEMETYIFLRSHIQNIKFLFCKFINNNNL